MHKVCVNRVCVNGREWTIPELSKACGVSYQTLVRRIEAGKQGEELIRPTSQTLAKNRRTLDDVTTGEIRGLRSSYYAWKGQQDGWEIACDLLGISREYAEKLRALAGALWYDGKRLTDSRVA